MERTTTIISQADVDRQLEHCQAIAAVTAQWPEKPLAFVDTYGCQQNEADSERIRGYLEQMGFGFTQDEEEARIIVINTCAIREHAEQRVLGNVGALVHVKRRHPEQMICLCGCMMQEKHVADKIRQSYRHVDLVFGPHALWKFPEMIHSLLRHRGRIFSNADEAGSIAEGIPMAGCPLCTAATTSVPTASSPMSGAGSAPASRRTFWPRCARWWPRAIRISPCWART